MTFQSSESDPGSLKEGQDEERAALSASCRLPPEILTQIYQVLSTSPRSISTLLQLERHVNRSLKPTLYNRVIIESTRQLSLFKRTILSNKESLSLDSSSSLQTGNEPDLSKMVKSLYISNDPNPTAMSMPAMNTETSDRLLQSLTHLNHLVLDLSSTYSPSNGLYQMRNLRQLTLIHLESSTVISGLLRNQAEMIAEIMRKEQVLKRLGFTKENQEEQEIGLSPRLGFAGDRVGTIQRLSKEIYGKLLPLKRLELVSFPGSLLASLFQLTSLTHLVLTKPIPPKRPQNLQGQLLPGLRILPQSSISFLLSSKTLQRIIIRDTLYPLERIVEELEGIECDKLRFRVLGEDCSQLWKLVEVGTEKKTDQEENLNLNQSSAGSHQGEKKKVNHLVTNITESRERIPALDLKDEFKKTCEREKLRSVKISNHLEELKHAENELKLQRLGLKEDQEMESSRQIDKVGSKLRSFCNLSFREGNGKNRAQLRFVEVENALSPWNSDQDSESEDGEKGQESSPTTSANHPDDSSNPNPNPNPNLNSDGKSASPKQSRPTKLSCSIPKPDRLELPPPFADQEGDICGATRESYNVMKREFRRRIGGGVRMDGINGIAFY